MKCPNPDCGKEVQAGAQYCEHCYTELPETLPEEGSQEVVSAPEVLEPEPEAPELGVGTPQEGKARLIVTRGSVVGTEYALNPGENEIGRWDDEEDFTPHIDLTEQDDGGYVHRRHAIIRFDGSTWWLEHLKPEPSNPTRIRNRDVRLKVGDPVALEPGDEIVVGRVILRFMVG